MWLHPLRERLPARLEWIASKSGGEGAIFSEGGDPPHLVQQAGYFWRAFFVVFAANPKTGDSVPEVITRR
jgi:hypothetical protein